MSSLWGPAGGKAIWTQKPRKGWDGDGAEQAGVGLGRRKFPAAGRKPCVTFGLCSYPEILDSRPFLASLGVGAAAGAQPAVAQGWSDRRGTAVGGEHRFCLKLGSSMLPGQHVTPEK